MIDLLVYLLYIIYLFIICLFMCLFICLFVCLCIYLLRKDKPVHDKGSLCIQRRSCVCAAFAANTAEELYINALVTLRAGSSKQGKTFLAFTGNRKVVARLGLGLGLWLCPPSAAASRH